MSSRTFSSFAACRLWVRLVSTPRQAALAARFARLLPRPFVGGASLMRSFTAFARNLALLGSIHRRKSAFVFCHSSCPPSEPHTALLGACTNVSSRLTITTHAADDYVVQGHVGARDTN